MIQPKLTQSKTNLTHSIKKSSRKNKKKVKKEATNHEYRLVTLQNVQNLLYELEYY